MTRTIIEKANGFTLLIDDEPRSSIPYGPIDRTSGDRNYGFIDLADRPELAAVIHEARRSEGLQRLLETVNAVGSRFRTLGCECGLFNQPLNNGQFDRYIGSYVAITFRSTNLNNAQRIEQLTRAAMAHVAVEDTSAPLFYEITVTPLRSLFGEQGRFEMHVNVLGPGNSDERAWYVFGIGCKGLAHAFEQLNKLPDDDPLFS